MFVAALFVMAPHWKPLSYPTAGQWLSKLVHPHQEIERSKLWKYTTTWMDLQDITLKDIELTSEGHVLCNSMYLTFSKWQDCRDGEQSGGCQEGVREMVAGNYMGDRCGLVQDLDLVGNYTSDTVTQNDRHTLYQCPFPGCDFVPSL